MAASDWRSKPDPHVQQQVQQGYLENKQDGDPQGLHLGTLI